MQPALIILFGLLGASLASFLNVFVDRLPRDASLLRPASHCDSCQRSLSIRDNIPIVSYLWLKGRCRYCQAKVPLRVLVIEIVGAVSLPALYWYYGLTLQLLMGAIWVFLFSAITIIDIEHNLILNKITYPAMAFAAITSLLPSGPGILASILGGFTGFILLFLPAIIYRGGMGWGDIKLAALIGLLLGYKLALAAILIGIVSGGLVGGALLLFHIRQRHDTLPFGPFLSLGAVVALLKGVELMEAYLKLF